MGIFSRFLPKKEQKALNPNFTTQQPISGLLTPLQIDYTQDTAYTSISAVYTVVNYLMTKFSSIPIRVYKVQDEKALKELKRVQPFQYRSVYNFLRTTKLQRKALEQVDEGNDLARLLQQPNKAMTSDIFFKTLYGFKLLKGEGFIWANRGEGSAGNLKVKPLEIYPLPPQLMHLVPDKNDVYGILQWVIQLPQLQPLPVDDVRLWKYARFDFDSTTHIHLRGQSPLTAGFKDLQGISAVDESYKATFTNRGANGILMAEDAMLSSEQISSIIKHINERVNGYTNAGTIAGGAGKYQFFDLSMSARDMELLQAKKFSVTQVAQLYNVPAGIWDLTESANNNITQYRAQVYTDKLMSEMADLLSILNSWLLPAYGMTGRYYIGADYSEIPDLQEDFQRMISGVKDMWEITPNEKRELMGYDPIEDELMDTNWVPSGFKPLQDAAIDISDVTDDMGTATGSIDKAV